MKNFLFILIGFSLLSCSTQKVLKTDTQQEIDLSGRWNDTDAEIATSELFNNLLTSTWLKKYETQNNLKPRLEILEFEGNFKEGGEQLEKYFIQYVKADSSIELIEEKNEKIAEYKLGGEIKAEEFITESQNYIDYLISSKLVDLDGNILWQKNTIIKKYIKD
jgi:hypothetical protein